MPKVPHEIMRDFFCAQKKNDEALVNAFLQRIPTISSTQTKHVFSIYIGIINAL